MEKKVELDKIEKEIEKIRPLVFYGILNAFLSFIGGMFIFYGLYHGKQLLYLGVGGIWIVAGIAVYVIGHISNHYKEIISQLIGKLRSMQVENERLHRKSWIE